MRLALCLALSFFLSAPNAFADQFNIDLKTRDVPTIKFTSPKPDQTVSPFSLQVSWERTKAYNIDNGNLGMVIENVETGERIFLGDGNSVTLNALSRRTRPLNVDFGRYRMIGYHYGWGQDSYSYAGIGPEFNVGPQTETFWTKWGEAEKFCPKFSGTKNYRIDDIKHITCEDMTCVEPNFFWNAGNYAFLDQRPVHLPDDKHIIKVTCLIAPQKH